MDNNVPAGTPEMPRPFSDGVRIALVDDHPLVRAALRMVLDATPGLQVCVEAQDGPGGVRAVLDERPDVTLMDLAMPGFGGVEATRTILAGWPQARVVVLTAFADHVLVDEAVGAGAVGYVLKDASPGTVVDAVLEAARGGRPVRPDLARPCA
ncbi:response regulator [Ornithinimicrobium sp. W1665]|uniref:response regulator n=1 Tax=Ornithinimicrobium sp. W1665 TaxID=3416666 RepID=UPI003CE9C132